MTALNRAVALARVYGAAAALAEVEAIESGGALEGYYLLPSVKARLLTDLGDHAGAAASYRAALACGCSDPERRLLSRRLADAERHLPL